MNAESYDDALTWHGGESDPTHVDSEVVDTPAGEVDDAEPGMSSALLVTLGVFGGVFLLFIVGWIIAAQRATVPTGNSFYAFMYVVGEMLAVVSPAAWFFAVLVLTRERRAGIRLLWMLLGVALLAPWPFILSIGATA